MPTKELDVLMQRKDKNGNIEIHYPYTKMENVIDMPKEVKERSGKVSTFQNYIMNNMKLR